MNKQSKPSPRKSPFNGKLFEGRVESYGVHPKCRKCLTRKEGKCKYIQYNAQNVEDFFCADYKE